MNKKKSLYEILEVPQNAGYPEIQASHARLLEALEARQSVLSRDDYTMQLRLLKVAYSTLSTPMSRDAYDAHLTTRTEPVKPNTALQITPTPSASLSAAALRADAMLMRAEAMALRADALGLKADVVGGFTPGEASPSESGTVQRLRSSLRTVLLTLGTLVALGMVFKVVFLSMGSRQPEEMSNARSQAEDKVYLQEYFQTYGVRPASRAEAQLMDAERRKKEETRRAQSQVEEERTKAARAAEKFEEESRKRGEQVTIELQYAEEKARRARQEEERQKNEERRRQAEAERERLEVEQAKWRRILDRPSPAN